MTTLIQVLDQAISKPFNEWTLEEKLAYEISKSDTEIFRLQKKLKQEKEHNQRLQYQWYNLTNR